MRYLLSTARFAILARQEPWDSSRDANRSMDALDMPPMVYSVG